MSLFFTLTQLRRKSDMNKKMIAISVTLGLVIPTFLNSVIPNSAYAQRRTASKSWCLGMKQQWQFRYNHFGINDEAIRASLEENNCAHWGVKVPGMSSSRTSTSNSRPPSGTASKSWCLGMKQQWEFRYNHFGINDESIRASLDENNCRYWGVRVR